ncbi:MAG: flagellar biosynthesis protein FlhF [Motiliproteus sp.]
MKVRRFFAPDMAQAMRLVRDEVGSDAVILSNSRVAGGVEVVVALEYDESIVAAARPRKAAKGRHLSALEGRKRDDRLGVELGRTRAELAKRRAASEGSGSLVQAASNRQLSSIDDQAWDEVLASVHADQSSSKPAAALNNSADGEMLRSMRSEIEDLKQMLRDQISQQQGNEVGEDPVLGKLRSRLGKVGISAALSERLIRALEPGVDLNQAWKISLSRLVESLPVAGEDVVDRGGVLAFVGATGVGKTTTIGKLAAQYVLKHGSSGVALITTDSYRIAAHEQLRTFGRILDIPVRVVDENHSLDEALRSLRDRRVVLIDTAGVGGMDQQREEQLQMLVQSSCRIKKYLVLPCTAQQQVLQSAYEYFKPIGLNGAVLSKVDESVSLGEVISTVVEQRLPVAYLADGQKIPDNIEVAKAKALVSRAVVLASGQQSRVKPVVLHTQHSDAV